MHRKDYSDARVRKIAGLNLLRLVKQVTDRR
jgi:microsomal dipeptidase-like Zn-dependent dipeptidase